MSRAKTAEEVRKQFLEHILSLVDYWTTVENRDGKPKSVKDRLSGLAFSILSTIDGASDLPSFDMIPSPHESDKQFHIDNGEDWYEPVVMNNCHLHEEYCAMESSESIRVLMVPERHIRMKPKPIPKNEWNVKKLFPDENA